jgi:CRISPR-associated protein Csx17
MIVHELNGCAPAPLAHYLKALGILRLVAEQADPQARGWWEGERFRLASRLDRGELEHFFLECYAPTPFVSPWNKGSGFFYRDDPGLTPVAKSTAERFRHFRDGIAAAAPLLAQLTEADETVRVVKAMTTEFLQRELASVEKVLCLRTKENQDTNALDALTKYRKVLEQLSAAHMVLQAIKDEGNENRLSSKERNARNKSPEYKASLKDATENFKKLKKQLEHFSEYKLRLAEVERKFKTAKSEFIPHCRFAWRGPHREWMDAAMVLGDDGTAQFPALLGTGGNDGRLDFTNNFMQRLGEVFDLDTAAGSANALARDWIAGALWADSVTGCQTGSAVGQYLPGMAGGANSANGPDGDSLLNPVDFLLMMEGTVLFTAHATRRLGMNESSRAAAPFVVNAQSAGYASAADSDESARGEQWMPLWLQPMTLVELKRLLAEGRAQIGAKPVRDPLDLALAVARLGTARGIAAFQRYGYIERNGQSNLAVPLGRFSVPDQVLPQVSCLDDLEVWMRQLKSATREETEKEKNNSRRLRGAVRRLSDSMLKVIQQPMMPPAWQFVLENLVDVEEIIASGRGFSKTGPLPKLRPEWVEAADDGSAELRLALSLALQARAFSRNNGTPLDPIRRHWLPLDNEKPWKFSTTGTGSQTRLLVGPEVVMHGRKGIDDAIALVDRRLIESSQLGERRLPLRAAVRAAAHPADLGAFISGMVNVDRTVALARALMALNHTLWPQQFIEVTRPKQADWPDDAWLVIRLALLPWPLKSRQGGEIRIGTDPAIFRRLASGDASTAVELALRRLRAAGVGATVRVATATPERARLWAAALAFPITQNTASAFVRRLDPNALPQGVHS